MPGDTSELCFAPAEIVNSLGDRCKCLGRGVEKSFCKKICISLRELSELLYLRSLITYEDEHGGSERSRLLAYLKPSVFLTSLTLY